MIYQDIFIQILNEVTGKSKSEIEMLLETFKRVHPGGKWDKELSDAEASSLLMQLRLDKDGIRRWLANGAARVARFETSTKH